jgi:hypothetical protein
MSENSPSDTRVCHDGLRLYKGILKLPTPA